MPFHRNTLAAVMLAAGSIVPMSASAAEKLTFYCSAQEDWCQQLAKGFEAETDIKVNMTRKSSGETLAQLKAEADNP